LCDQEFWAAGKSVIFSVATTMQNSSAIPTAPNLVVTEESSIGDPFGRNVITVAAYDDNNGVGGAGNGDIAAFSSRGPLRDFSDPASPLAVIAVKPDIAAPGVEIRSADGIHTEALTPRLPSFVAGRRFTDKSGTSMSTPMVAGVIALMLDKKPDLNITEARTALFVAPRAAVNPSAAPASTNAYGRGRVDAMTSHSNTP
jgi:subtilisin family serine protease